MTTIRPKLIEDVAKIIWETRDYSADNKAIAAIEALRPLMEEVARGAWERGFDSGMRVERSISVTRNGTEADIKEGYATIVAYVLAREPKP